MAKNNETTTKFNVDISQLKKGIQEANRQIRLANAEFKAAASGMDDWGSSTAGVQKKIEQLKKVLSNQQSILKNYEQQLALVEQEQGKNSAGAENLRIKIANQQAVVNTTAKSIQSYTGKLEELESAQSDSATKAGTQNTAYENLNTTINNQEKELQDLKKAYANASLEGNTQEAKQLAGQISSLSTELSENKTQMEKLDKEADNLDKSLDDVEKSAKETEGGFTVMKGALANLVSDGIELALNGLKQLGSSMVNVGKQAISNYSEYEQLTGGVETLFGDSAKEVKKYANNAYKTAGMSANQYMETVTSFSASLLQGLNGDTAKSAKIADQAIVDMSDNANKMGTDMSLIQNAYQGFAKQNYTMLDNLKLGYGGTQKEMARLINDSGVLGDTMTVTEKNVNEVSFDKIIEAIHVVQSEIGITGTTAEEASTTIEGSANSMKSSWQNLLTGLADEDADMSELIDKFIESAETYLGNVLPRIGTLVQRVVDYAKTELEERFPEAMSTLESIGKVIENVFGFIVDNSNVIISALAGILAGFIAWKTIMFIQRIPAMITALKTAIMGLNAVMAANPIGVIITLIVGLVTAFVVLWNKSEAFRNFWIGLWEGIKSAVSTVVEAIAGFFTGLWDGIKTVWETVSTWFMDTVITPLVTIFTGLLETLSGIFTSIWESIVEIFSPAIEWFTELFTSIWNSLKSIIQLIVGLVQGTWIAIKAIWGVVANWFNKHVITPLKTFFTKMWNGIKSAGKTAWNSIKAVWTVVSGWFNEKIITPVKTFFGGMWDKLKSGAKDAWDGIKSVFSKVTSWFKDKFSKAWQAVKDVFSTGGKVFDGIKDGIVSAFKTVVNAIIRGINKVIAVPFKAINKILEKIKKVSVAGIKPFKNIITELNIPEIPELESGGVLRRGQVGLLEGNGAEAVVPLEKNKAWIAKTARDLKNSLETEGLIGNSGSAGASVTNYTFNQTNNSPKPLSRLEIYRQTKNQIAFMKGV